MRQQMSELSRLIHDQQAAAYAKEREDEAEHLQQIQAEMMGVSAAGSGRRLPPPPGLPGMATYNSGSRMMPNAGVTTAIGMGMQSSSGPGLAVVPGMGQHNSHRNGSVSSRPQSDWLVQ